MEKHYERIYEDFKKDYPRMVDRVIERYPRGAHTISMRMGDGVVINYNPVTHLIYADNPDDAINISELGSIRTFGAKLTAMMDQRGMTVDELAYYTGISKTSIYKYRRGENAAGWPTVLKLAQALSCELDEFR